VHTELKGRYGRVVDDEHLAGLVGSRERPGHFAPVPRGTSSPALQSALLRPLAEYEAVVGGGF
jgi:hypothetical protein